MAETTYSKSELKRAGRSLRGNILWTPETEQEARRIFEVANDFRQSHDKPMRRLRLSVDGYRRSLNVDGLTVSRLKRMPSIRRKLSHSSTHLTQMQDIGGCRTIVTTISGVDLLVDRVLKRTKHALELERNYIEHPKDDGYRCRHLVFRFTDENDQSCDGRRIEWQVRTRLQHAWATAVEVVGTYRDENMKAGEGDPRWLRLFRLLSFEMSLTEGVPQPPGLGTAEEVREEIIGIERELDAIRTLDGIRKAFEIAGDSGIAGNDQSEYFIISYDREDKSVSVRPYSRLSDGARRYNQLEEKQFRAGNHRFDTVLVSGDKLDSLQEAFPNYFGDVEVFCDFTRRVVGGERTEEYSLPPKRQAPSVRVDKPDLSWFSEHKRRNWVGGSKKKRR